MLTFSGLVPTDSCSFNLLALNLEIKPNTKSYLLNLSMYIVLLYSFSVVVQQKSCLNLCHFWHAFFNFSVNFGDSQFSWPVTLRQFFSK